MLGIQVLGAPELSWGLLEHFTRDWLESQEDSFNNELNEKTKETRENANQTSINGPPPQG